MDRPSSRISQGEVKESKEDDTSLQISKKESITDSLPAGLSMRNLFKQQTKIGSQLGSQILQANKIWQSTNNLSLQIPRSTGELSIQTRSVDVNSSMKRKTVSVREQTI